MLFLSCPNSLTDVVTDQTCTTVNEAGAGDFAEQPAAQPPVIIDKFINSDLLLIEICGDFKKVKIAVREKDETEYGTSVIFEAAENCRPGLYSIPFERNYSDKMKFNIYVDFATRYGEERAIRIYSGSGELLKDVTSVVLRDTYRNNNYLNPISTFEIEEGINFSDAESSMLNNRNYSPLFPTVFFSYENEPKLIEVYWNGAKIFRRIQVNDTARYPSIKIPATGTIAIPLDRTEDGELEYHLYFDELPELDSVFTVFNNQSEILLKDSPTLINYSQADNLMKLKLSVTPEDLNVKLTAVPFLSPLEFTSSKRVVVSDGFSGELLVPAFNRDADETVWCGFPTDSQNTDFTGNKNAVGNCPQLVMDNFQRQSYSSDRAMVLRTSEPFSYDYANPDNNIHSIKLLAVDENGYTAADTVKIEVLPFADKNKPKVYFDSPYRSVLENQTAAESFTVTIKPALPHAQDVKIRIGGNGSNASDGDYSVSGLSGCGAVRTITIPAGGSGTFNVSAVRDDLYPYYDVVHTNINKVSSEKIVFSVELTDSTVDCRLPISSESEYSAISRSFTIKDDGDEPALRIRKTPGTYLDGFADSYLEGGADISGMDQNMIARIEYYYPGWTVEANPAMSENGSNTIIPGRCPDYNEAGWGTSPVMKLSAVNGSGEAVDIETLFRSNVNRFKYQWNYSCNGYGGIYYLSSGEYMCTAVIGADGVFTRAPAKGYMNLLKGTVMLDDIDSDITITVQLLDGSDYRLSDEDSIELIFKNK